MVCSIHAVLIFYQLHLERIGGFHKISHGGVQNGQLGVAGKTATASLMPQVGFLPSNAPWQCLQSRSGYNFQGQIEIGGDRPECPFDGVMAAFPYPAAVQKDPKESIYDHICHTL